jgi:hypothetical protein
MTIEEMERLYEEATQGEWIASTSGHFLMSGHECIASFVNCDGDTHANERLVTAMHRNLPALLAVVKAAKALRNGLIGAEQTLCSITENGAELIDGLDASLLPFAERQG